MKNEPLTWSPSDTLNLGVRQDFRTLTTVRFLPFTDTANKPSLIGRNVEHQTVEHLISNTGKVIPIPRLVTTSDEVGPFV